MKKRLSEVQFQEAIQGLDVGPQTLSIARAVLVEGKPQVSFVAELGLSKGAVSQAVNRVWAAAKKKLPEGFKRVSVVLPEHQAYIVQKWAEEAKRKRKQEPKS